MNTCACVIWYYIIKRTGRRRGVRHITSSRVSGVGSDPGQDAANPPRVSDSTASSAAAAVRHNPPSPPARPRPCLELPPRRAVPQLRLTRASGGGGGRGAVSQWSDAWRGATGASRRHQLSVDAVSPRRHWRAAVQHGWHRNRQRPAGGEGPVNRELLTAGRGRSMGN